MADPKITVLMAVYNGASYLRDAIDSILRQTYHDWEFLIINGGSTDSTRDIILSYADDRIHLVDNDYNMGLTRSLNRGLRLAKGELVARQDADDVSEPERFARQVAFLEQHLDVVLVGTWYTKIDAAGEHRGYRKLPTSCLDVRWSLLFFCPFVHTAVMFRKSVVLTRVGYYDESFSYSQDYELWSRIGRDLPAENIDAYLVRLRANPSSMTATYGDKTQEGHRLRTANLARLLGWDSEQAEQHRIKYYRLQALVTGTASSLSSVEIVWALTEMLRLHRAFCRLYGVRYPACITHRLRVLATVAPKAVGALCRDMMRPGRAQ